MYQQDNRDLDLQVLAPLQRQELQPPQCVWVRSEHINPKAKQE